MHCAAKRNAAKDIFTRKKLEDVAKRIAFLEGKSQKVKRAVKEANARQRLEASPWVSSYGATF